jgi:hypothetical protein
MEAHVKLYQVVAIVALIAVCMTIGGLIADYFEKER